jgi:predicted permease
MSLPRIRYQTDTDVVKFYDQVSEKVRNVQGVMDASFAYPLPLDGGAFGTSFRIIANGHPSDQYADVPLRLIDSRYFSVMNIPLLQGREFSETDTAASEPVCIISQKMAQHYWPNQQAVGQLLVVTRGDVNGKQSPRRIVGMVADVRDRVDQEPEPTLYVPYAQMPFPTMTLVVYSRHSAATVAKSVAGVLQTVDPDQPIRGVGELDGFLPGSLGPWTEALTLLGGLAGLSVLLTAMGVFAVISYMVRERTREIGIRIAIGASSLNVRNMVLRQTAWLAGAGLVIGIVLSEACTRLLGGLIYGVKPTDPLTFAAAAVALGSLAMLASYLPARRATQVDPMIILRAE